MKLTEVFDTSSKYTVGTATAHQFSTSEVIGGREIKLHAEEHHGDDGWMIEFSDESDPKNKFGDTGKGEVFKIMSFVKASIEEFVERYKPEKITFTADDLQRMKIYRKIASQLKKYKEAKSTQWGATFIREMKIVNGKEAEERSVLAVLGDQSKHYPSRAFLCNNQQLTSLEGSPEICQSFDGSKNELTSLKGGPHEVLLNYNCYGNKLTSLEGAPERVGHKGSGSFDCSNNQLTSLKGLPKYIGASLYCQDNKLTSLHGIDKELKQMGGSSFSYANFSGNPIKSHVLGLLQIDGLTRVVLGNKDVQIILNHHLNRDRDIFACQEELIEAGFPEFAKL